MPAEGVVERARDLRLMAFDVDGVLTDGVLHLDENGAETKNFNTLDGQGLRMLQDNGVLAAIISGRRARAVDLRAENLGVRYVFQGIQDKLATFDALLATLGLGRDEAGYMGDDLPDLGVLTRCGFAATVPGAPEAVRVRVHYVTTAAGGRGAVREVCEFVLRAQHKLDAAIAAYLR